MVKLFLLFGIIALASAHAAPPKWHELNAQYGFDQYMTHFGKTYDSVEEQFERQLIFERKLAKVLIHNDNPNSSYKKGINQLSDRTEQELNALLGLDKSAAHFERHVLKSHDKDFTADTVELTDIPESLDWRNFKGQSAVTPVKNQGACGSCWTFGSVETLESHWFLATGIMQELSEQFVLDCTPNPQECGGTGGCGGGTAALAYDRLKALTGIPSEWTYPYVSGNGNASQCHGLPLNHGPQPHTGSVRAAANVTGRVAVTSNDYTAVINALVTQGPMAISVDASEWSDYESGVFDGGNMTNPDLDHVVQLVGYGSENGQDYWLVRNSWTPLWGELGYIRLKRFGATGDVPCGTDLTPMDGDGCKGGPPTVKVCGQNGVLYDAAYPLVN